MAGTEIKWEKWEPVTIPDDGERYFIQNYYFTDDGRDKIILDNGTHQVKIEFQGYTWATRITADGDRLAGGNDSPVFFTTPPKYLKNNDFLFKGYNTDFVRWFVQESAGVYEINEFVHFCIMDTLLVIDILGGEPKVSITDSKENEEMIQIPKSDFEEFQDWKAERDKAAEYGF